MLENYAGKLFVVLEAIRRKRFLSVKSRLVWVRLSSGVFGKVRVATGTALLIVTWFMVGPFRRGFYQSNGSILVFFILFCFVVVVRLSVYFLFFCIARIAETYWDRCVPTRNYVPIRYLPNYLPNFYSSILITILTR